MSLIPELLVLRDQNILMLILGTVYISAAYYKSLYKEKIPHDVLFISLIFISYFFVNIVIHRYLKPWYIFGPFLFTSTILLKSCLLPYSRRIISLYLLISVSLLAIVLFQILFTFDPLFMRNNNILFELFFNIFPINNPNFYSRTVLCLIPILLLARVLNIHSKKLNQSKVDIYIMVIIGLFISVAMVAASRTNTLALVIFYLTYVSFFNKRAFIFTLPFLLFVLVIIINTPLMSILDSYLGGKITELSEVFNELYLTFLYSAADIQEVRQNRPKMYYGSYLIIKDNPLFGVGSEAPAILSDLGARAVQLGNGMTRLKSIHGGFLSLAVTGGLFSLGLFLIFQLYVWRRFIQNKSKVTPIAVSFIIASIIAQIGANIYEMSIFWLTLAVLYITHKAHPI